MLTVRKLSDPDIGYRLELAELGHRDVSPSRLVEMKIYNVTPLLIKKLRSQGDDDLSTREPVEFKIHGR